MESSGCNKDWNSNKLDVAAEAFRRITVISNDSLPSLEAIEESRLAISNTLVIGLNKG